MTKTIEELASEYYLNEVINGDTCDDKDGWTDCFVSGAKALMQLPLASRLIAEEKERVRKMYKELSECIENRTADVEYLKGKRCQLVIIFSDDFSRRENDMSIIDKYIAWQMECGAVVNAHNTKVALSFFIVIASIGLLMLAVGLIARLIEWRNNPYRDKFWSVTLLGVGAVLIGIPILIEGGGALVSYLYSIL